VSQSYSVRGSSDVAFRYHYCSSLLLLLRPIADIELQYDNGIAAQVDTLPILYTSGRALYRDSWQLAFIAAETVAAR